MKKHSSSGKRIQQVLASIASGIEQSSSIVVSQDWRRARTPQQQESVHRLLYSRLEFSGDGKFVKTGKNNSMQKKVDRVNMIISRLLEVETVGLDLTLRFSQNDFPSQGLPMFSSRDFRAKRPEKEQRDRFSHQMRIRREIGREVTLDMATVPSLGTKPFFSEFSRH